ncbi:hypothetical protein C4572_02555 [Candidatus Parcubacteria bacterium]|nr:MAG: hypothetical protein C4572_02555 [Candidatus Parcubacteria bacterium]
MKKYLILTIVCVSFLLGVSVKAADYVLEMWTYIPYSTWGAYSYITVCSAPTETMPCVLISQSEPVYTVNQWVKHQIKFSTFDDFISYEAVLADASPGDVMYVDNVFFGQITLNCCGNKILENGEDCDDGNSSAGDYCSNICLNEGSRNFFPGQSSCGNGFKELGEECDFGAEPNADESDGCTDWCTFSGSVPGKSLCGDGIVGLGEECDSFGFTDPGCSAPSTDAPDLCRDQVEVECLSPFADDGTPYYGQSCFWDDIADECYKRPCLDATLTAFGNMSYDQPVCGNGIREFGEDCDDGNAASGDGCSGTDDDPDTHSCSLLLPGSCVDNPFCLYDTATNICLNRGCLNEGSYYEYRDPSDAGQYQLVLTDDGLDWGITEEKRYTEIEATAGDFYGFSSKTGEGKLTVIKTTPGFQVITYQPEDGAATVCLDQPLEISTSQKIRETRPGSNVPDLSNIYDSFPENVNIVSNHSADVGRNLSTAGLSEINSNFSYIGDKKTVRFTPPLHGFCSDNGEICYGNSDCTSLNCENIIYNWWRPNTTYTVTLNQPPQYVVSADGLNLDCSNDIWPAGYCEWSFTTTDYPCYYPLVTETAPNDGEMMCRNGQISAVFNQHLDDGTVMSREDEANKHKYTNVVLNECQGACPAAADYLNNIIGDQICVGGVNDSLPCDENNDCPGGSCRTGIEYYSLGQTSKLRIKNFNYGTCSQDSPVSGQLCLTNADCQTGSCDNAGFTTYLKPGTTYRMFLAGGPFGIKNEHNAPIGASTCNGGVNDGNFCSTDDDCDGFTCETQDGYSWTFSTTDDFCDCNYLEVEITRNGDEPQVSQSDFFTCTGVGCEDDADPVFEGNQHIYQAQCYDVSAVDEEPTEVAALYTWNEIDNDNIFDITIDGGNTTEVFPFAKNGTSQLEAIANYIVGSETSTARRKVTITNFICSNPWPSFDSFPFSDSDSVGEPGYCDIDGTACNDFHFDLFYCRDSGRTGFSDDLPAISLDPTVVGRQGEKLKEFLFFNQEQQADLVVDSKSGLEADALCSTAFALTDGKVVCTDDDDAREFEFSFDFPYPGNYQLDLTSLNHNNDTVQDLSAFNISHNVNIYLNTNWIGQISPAASGTTTSSLVFEVVTAGAQTISLDWTNDWLQPPQYDSNFTVAEIKISFGQYTSDDAVGIRVMQNPHNLNPYTWYISGTCPNNDICFDESDYPLVSNQGLEGFWKFDEHFDLSDAQDQVTALDSSGNSRNGTLSDESLRTEDGYIKSAVNFGGSQNVAVIHANDLNPAEEMTLTGWLNPLDDLDSDDLLIQKPGAYQLALDGKDLTLQLAGASAAVQTGNDAVLTQWGHFAATFKRGEVKIYYNGQEKAKDYTDITTISYSVSDLLFGAGFEGRLDEIKIYSRALTAQEVAALYGACPCQFNVPNRGTARTSVDNYQAVQDGRTTYVGATNVDGQIFGNIYLISYNQGADEKTVEVYNRLVENWNFNNNIVSANECSSIGKPCSSDLDCRLEENPLSQDESLTAYLPFSENSGLRTADFSGNNLNSDLNGAAWTVGRIGYGLDFDLVDYVAVADSELLDLPSGAVSLWFDPEVTNSSNLISKGNSYYIELNPLGQVSCGLNGSTVQTAGMPINSGYNFVACAWDGTQLKIMLNENISDAAAIFASPNPNVSNLNIGTGFSGSIDEVMIFDRMLSDEELQNMYFAAGGGVCLAKKDKIARDAKRVGDMSEIDLYSKQYEKLFNLFPDLNGGTYVRKNTVSVWPSWDEVLKPQFSALKPYSLIGSGMPKDPLNKVSGCSEPFDSQTCWDEKNKLFACPIDSYIYAYYSDLNKYYISASLEYLEYDWSGITSGTSDIILKDICFNVSGTSVNDLDGDGIIDSDDNCPPSMCLVPSQCYNPDQGADLDQDGIGDICDSCVDGNDLDADGICEDTDNCPTVYNPVQNDSDSDLLGDACDFDCHSDSDGDTVCDENDNCPTVRNLNQLNSDAASDLYFSHVWPNGQPFGDSCDPCTDSDADSRWDVQSPVNTCQKDNCSPQTAGIICTGPDPNDPADRLCPTNHPCCNPYQEDYDNDLAGYICDFCVDVDGDGYGDERSYPGHNSACPAAGVSDQDNCPVNYNPAQTDCDGDGLGDACSSLGENSDAAREENFQPGVCVSFPMQYSEANSDLIFWLRLDDPSFLFTTAKDSSGNNRDGIFCDDTGCL